MKQGKNIKRLKIWGELEKLGFHDCKYTFQGLYYQVGGWKEHHGNEIIIEPSVSGNDWKLTFYCGDITLLKYIPARQILSEINEILK